MRPGERVDERNVRGTRTPGVLAPRAHGVNRDGMLEDDALRGATRAAGASTHERHDGAVYLVRRLEVAAVETQHPAAEGDHDRAVVCEYAAIDALETELTQPYEQLVGGCWRAVERERQLVGHERQHPPHESAHAAKLRSGPATNPLFSRDQISVAT